MKIGIDASRANNDHRTGVENYAFHVIEELKKCNVEDGVEFILYTNSPLTGELAQMPRNWTQKVLKWPPKRLWTQVRLSWEMLWQAPDVLFIPAHVFPIIHPKKTVMTVHDIAATRFPKSYNWFERWYSIWSARRALKKLWNIIVPSEFTKRELESLKVYTVRKNNINVILHGYDGKYHQIKDERRVKNVLQKYGIEKPFFMSLGRLEEKKNTVRIIQAFEKMRDQLRTASYELPVTNCQLLLVGKPGYGYEKVAHAIKNSKYKNDIIAPGFVCDEDTFFLLGAADIFVFPSLYEGFGLPVLEAMACGTPVVTSQGSSLEEVGKEACVYVDPLDSTNIKDGIVTLLKNSEIRHEKIDKGIKRVQDFSWKTCATQTLDVLLN